RLPALDLERVQISFRNYAPERVPPAYEVNKHGARLTNQCLRHNAARMKCSPITPAPAAALRRGRLWDARAVGSALRLPAAIVVCLAVMLAGCSGPPPARAAAPSSSTPSSSVPSPSTARSTPGGVTFTVAGTNPVLANG